MDYLLHAMEKEKEEAAWELWKGLYPLMIRGFVKEISFTEFRHKLITSQANLSNKAAAEIEAEMLPIIAAYKGR